MVDSLVGPFGLTNSTRGIRRRVDPLDSDCQNIENLEISGGRAMQLMSGKAVQGTSDIRVVRSYTKFIKE